MTQTDNYQLVHQFGPLVPQTSEDLEQAVREGLFSLDANILLNFYRYSPSARDALERILRALGDRVWVSHQAAREFWRNRMNALDDRSAATDQLIEQLGKVGRTIETQVSAWAKRIAADDEAVHKLTGDLLAALSGAQDVVRGEMGDEGLAFSYDPTNDPIVESLADVLEGRVGAELPPDEHENALKEGRRRCAEGIPPGFCDTEKGAGETVDGGVGDYLVWHQSLLEATKRNIPLVVLTGDEKEDWWWKHRAVFLGPREELAKECADVAGVALYMMRPVQLLQLAQVLQVEVSAAAVGEVNRATSLGELPDLRGLLTASVESVAHFEGGWAPLATVGHWIARAHPSFDFRDYGYEKLSHLARAQDYLEVRTFTHESGDTHPWVRLREPGGQRQATGAGAAAREPEARQV